MNSHTHTGPSHTHTTGNHTLTIDEMPSHNHYTRIDWGGSSGNIAVGSGSQRLKVDQDSVGTGAKGGGNAHNHGNTGASGTGNTGAASPGTSNALSTAVNNLQPYITVYMWKRTA